MSVRQPPASAARVAAPAPPPPPPPQHSTNGFTYAVAAVVLFVLLLGLAWGSDSFDAVSVAVLLPLLVIGTIPLARREARRFNDPQLALLIVVAAAAKLSGSVLRIVVALEVYGTAADAAQYHRVGVHLAAAFRAGNYDLGERAVTGTRFLEVFTGVVYSVVGANRAVGYLVFSWLGFIGLVLFHRAFRVAMPHGDSRRYAKLLFFLPSLVFWSSSIGKEAWMTLALGLAAAGYAQLVTRRLPGLVAFGLGAWGAALVRPHVALILIAAASFGLLATRSRRVSGSATISKLVVLVVLVTGLVFAIDAAERFFKVERLDQAAATSEFDQAEERTTKGGSAFEPARVRTPLDLPAAIVTVLFRPLPGEVPSAQGILASLEGLLLICLFVGAIRKVIRAPLLAFREAYVATAIAYTLGFVYAFSVISNFGLLARQRVQVLPFVLVLLALPPLTDGARRQKQRSLAAPRSPLE